MMEGLTLSWRAARYHLCEVNHQLVLLSLMCLMPYSQYTGCLADSTTVSIQAAWLTELQSVYRLPI